jgi:hypothetical protein
MLLGLNVLIDGFKVQYKAKPQKKISDAKKNRDAADPAALL